MAVGNPSTQHGNADISRDRRRNDICWKAAPAYRGSAAAEREPGVRLDIEHRADLARPEATRDRTIEPITHDRSIEQRDPAEPARQAAPIPDTRGNESRHECAGSTSAQGDRVDEGQSMPRAIAFPIALQRQSHQDLLAGQRQQEGRDTVNLPPPLAGEGHGWCLPYGPGNHSLKAAASAGSPCTSTPFSSGFCFPN